MDASLIELSIQRKDKKVETYVDEVLDDKE